MNFPKFPQNHFEFIVIMFPTTLDNNKTYLFGKWIFNDKNVVIVEGKLNEWIKLFRNTVKFHQTLFIIDDCSAEGEINKKEMHYQNLLLAVDIYRNHSLWVLTQKYNSISKDVREQLEWLFLFFTKENERDRLKKCLQNKLYSKLILKRYQPIGYYLL